MAGWHHRCNEHELGQTLGGGEGQGGLTCCSPWGCKELNMTGQLNNNRETSYKSIFFPCQFLCSVILLWFLPPLPPTPSSPVNLENSFLTLTPSSIFLINPFWSFPSPEHNPASIGGYVAGLVLAQGLQNK